MPRAKKRHDEAIPDDSSDPEIHSVEHGSSKSMRSNDKSPGSVNVKVEDRRAVLLPSIQLNPASALAPTPPPLGSGAVLAKTAKWDPELLVIDYWILESRMASHLRVSSYSSPRPVRLWASDTRSVQVEFDPFGDRVKAFYIQTYGETASSKCDHCQEASLTFGFLGSEKTSWSTHHKGSKSQTPLCRRLTENHRGGACGNCTWSYKVAQCSFYSKRKVDIKKSIEGTCGNRSVLDDSNQRVKPHHEPHPNATRRGLRSQGEAGVQMGSYLPLRRTKQNSGSEELQADCG